MVQYERRQIILEELSRSEVVLITDLVGTLGTSPSTVRRDVDALVKTGQVIALRGGAIRLNDRLAELPTEAKALIRREAKQAIAAAAVARINDGDTVYIDSGTTALQMVPLLRSRRIHIITSNTHVLAITPGERMRVTMLPGEFIANTGSVAGSFTEQLLESLYFDKAFIGASGASLVVGISTFDIREATKKRIVHDHSTEPYVLLDSSKFGKSALCKALDLGECTVITDEYHDLLSHVKASIIASRPPARNQSPHEAADDSAG